MVSARFLYSVPVANILGEGVIWDAGQQQVWWTDIEACLLYCFAPSSRELTQYKLPRRLCSFALTDNPGTILAAFDTGFGLYQLDSGELEWLACPETAQGPTRLNDGRVDGAGRFWCGSMVEGNAGVGEQGSLYSLDRGECRSHCGGFEIFNGLAWSRDKAWLYCADSAKHLIYRHPWEPEYGSLGPAEIFARTPDTVFPDGSAVDVGGGLWNAQWNGSRVVRYTPEGQIDFVLHLPVSQPSCVSFGGPDMNLLFVTTASTDLSAEQISRQPEAGNLLVYQISGVTGTPASKYNI
ncbi:SMP-30/gluconolactonase/LRE family protein [Shewanella submarina]|uniref:SMP-30/gluconolactonase/LRE family protein n=1 Tax=Shewanella submarina TaxID=2016376 RepID=A0ABV7GEC9_9GAMM|nr:SMP-30/gluconolactonase/LRE family protein [Shewanella submarina]MCL1037227.1 SMP-30/gluconolactonase/LRE family protein [Shewanella submarina]